MTSIIRLIGVGGLDFHVHQGDKNIASISADIVTPLERILQPLIFIGIYYGNQITISYQPIASIRRITLIKDGVAYSLPLTNNSNSYVTLPSSIGIGVAKLIISTDSIDYVGNVVITEECTLEVKIVQTGPENYEIEVETIPSVEVIISNSDQQDSLGTTDPSGFLRAYRNLQPGDYIISINSGSCQQTYSFTIPL